MEFIRGGDTLVYAGNKDAILYMEKQSMKMVMDF